MRIDIGCGQKKHLNCIGIDRIAYKSTDIVHDYNEPIPLENDSVDFVMCSHSLQYVDDLHQVMKEIYRICKHKAIVCIVAPYAHATVHMVNPRFKQQFNEHSPKYWTTHPGRLQDENEFFLYPPMLALQQKDFGQDVMDFRLLRMEFFYFPTYHGLYNEVELGLLRQSQLNVAHQIMYHLLVVKDQISETEIAGMEVAKRLEEPDYVKGQRMQMSEKEEGDQPFYLDHFRSDSSTDEDSSSIEIEEKSPLLEQSSRGGGSKPKSSRIKTPSKPKRKTIIRKKAKARNKR
ncbi:methyltransferase domain-containing protein [Paenibacillus xylanexedens]|uniref:methyltransferase domain-containing protein n=1 Tax=Paenibacillus xylanexedens TaxID=528191 RepID=UPI003D05EC4D